MAKAFVYSVLAALLFAAHSATAFNLSIHDKMTEAERRAYGFENSGAAYKVFPMSLTGMRHKRKARENIRCTLVLDGEKIKLNLKPTSQYLATKYTPVWLAVSHRLAYNYVRYTPLPTAMSDIGKFTMYRDSENQAALVVYRDRSEKIVIEGIISWRYVIRSLPKRFFDESENIANDISKIPNTMGGAINSYEDAGFYAVINASPATVITTYDQAKPENAARRQRTKSNECKRKVPKKIYPEILLVLDHNYIRHRTVTEALRLTLAFWNGVSMLVRPLDKPKVRPNIAGIIIAGDDHATPYITDDAARSFIFDPDIAKSKMQKHFYRQRDWLPVKRYDLIVAMTTLLSLLENGDSWLHAELYPVYSNLSLKCSSERDVTRAEAVKNTVIVHYNVNFGPPKFFKQWGFLMDRLNSECVSTKRRTTVDDDFTPRECREKKYSAMFTTKETECYRNKPRSLRPVDEVVSDRWSSMDEQCRNEGFAKSCKLNNETRACEEKGCRSKGSKKCVRSEKVPLPGSKCGTNKRCNDEKKCVKNYGT